LRRTITTSSEPADTAARSTLHLKLVLDYQTAGN
jgi:hypothetical protein